VGDKYLERIVPANDIDSLAAQLVDDVLDTAAANAHASTDAIDFEVDARHGDFRAITRLAGDRLDFDGAVGDFGNLVLEKTANEIWVGSRQNYLHPMAHLANVEDYRLDALSNVVRFARNLLAAGQERLGSAECHRGGATVEALNRAIHQVAFLARVFLHD